MKKAAKVPQPTSPELTEALRNLSTATNIDDARELGRRVLALCVFPDTIPKKLQALERANTMREIHALCYNTVLSGEGLKVAT